MASRVVVVVVVEEAVGVVERGEESARSTALGVVLEPDVGVDVARMPFAAVIVVGEVDLVAL